MNISIDSAGRYIVSFGGTVFSPCENDVSCPGELICARNETWLALSSMCVCPLSLGRVGETCQDLNSSGWALVIISSLVFLIAISSLLINFSNLWSTFTNLNVRERIPKRSALFTTLLFTTLANLFTALQAAYQVASHFVPRTLVAYAKGELAKQSTLLYFNLVTTTLAFFFAITAALNISLVLIEIADRVSKGSSMIHINVFIYRRFLIAYCLGFAVAIIVLAAIGRAEFTYVVAAPATIFVAITFFIGYWRLSRLFQPDIRKMGGKTAKVDAAMNNIRITALMTSMCTTALNITVLCVVLFDDSNRPDSSLGAVPARLFWIFAALTMMVFTRYTHIHVTGKTGSTSKRTSTSDMNSPIVAKVREESTSG